MTKFIKTLIIINGIIIPLVFIAILVTFVGNLIDNNRYRGSETGVLTKNIFQKDTGFVARQGLDYSSPEFMEGTENYYITISVKTFEKPQTIENRVTKFSKLNLNEGETNYFNIVFLDKNYRVLRSLLTKKASITELVFAEMDQSLRTDHNIKTPGTDPTVKNIAYQIVYEDTNHDGKLDNKDLADLYISGIDGSDLTKVTQNIDIQKVKFFNKNTQLFIEYTDRKDIPEEYKELKFATYNIPEKTLIKLDGITGEISRIKGTLNKK